MNLAAMRERLRDLERQGALENLLAPHVEMPFADLIGLLQYPAFVAAAVHLTRMGLAARGTAARPGDGDLLWLVLLLGIAVLLRFGSARWQGRDAIVRQRVRRKGLLLPAAIVQANDSFGDPDNVEWRAANLLVSFDEAVLAEPARLVRAAERLLDLKFADRRMLPSAEAALAWDLYHEMGPVVSLPVPVQRAEGLRDAWLVSAMLPPQPLRVGDSLLVLALRGERSPHAVAVLPASVVS